MRDAIAKELNDQIISAIEKNDQATVLALLNQCGIDAYLKHSWTDDDGFHEPTTYELAGNAVNIAVHFKNEALAVELLRQGAGMRGTYHSSENALGWTEGTESLVELALFHKMPELTRTLMGMAPGVNWDYANRVDCDGWSAGRSGSTLFFKVMRDPKVLAFLQDIGLFAGQVGTHQVQVSAASNGFQILVDNENLGQKATMAEALAVVRGKVHAGHADREALDNAEEALHEAHAFGTEDDVREAEQSLASLQGEETEGPNLSDMPDEIPF